MSQLLYDSSPIKVREDLATAHGQVWQRLAHAGTWWTGNERVAIAAETRNALACPLCRVRKQSLSPSASQGPHSSLGQLPETVVDVIHRVVTDPGRLSKDWYDKLLASGLADTHYVETLAVIAAVVAVDIFARAIGVDPPELPSPQAGEPCRVRPAAAKVSEAWVPMIAVEDAVGPLSDLYSGDFAANIQRALSLVPDELRGIAELMAVQYLPIDQLMNPTAGRAISRPQMELIAARVSTLNRCFY